MTRPSFDEYWMDIAQVVSTRSTCLRRQIGAVLTHKNFIISAGYNGACSKLQHCTDTNICIRNENNIESGTQLEFCEASHAEANAILHCHVPLHSLPKLITIYTTTYPCPICAKLICESNIGRVVCYSPYSNQTAMELFAQSGVEVCWINQTISQ